MMFLTKTYLDQYAMRKEQIRDDYSIHRFVYSLFPVRNDGRRILYADQGAVPGGRIVLILSDEEPLPPDHVSSRSQIVSDDFLSFPDYRFQVAMNPVRKSKETGKRAPVTDRLDDWFCEHAAAWGFEVDRNYLEIFLRPTRTFPKNGRTATFHHVDFGGRLHVTDPALFRRAFAAGLGHGKAFGFGLLQLSPVHFISQN